MVNPDKQGKKQISILIRLEKKVIVTETTESTYLETPKSTVPATKDDLESEIKDKSESERARSGRWRQKITIELVNTWFAACARCGFFLAGYKLESGPEAMETAAAKSKAGWLSLPWTQFLCRLVQKSYGSGLDVDCYHYDGSCPECRRQFVYHVGEENGQVGRFRIELKPRAGR